MFYSEIFMKKMEPFWVKIIMRDLDLCYMGEGEESIEYICSDDSPEPEEIDITQLFYKLLRRHKELEKEGRVFIFELSAWHHEKYGYNSNGQIEEWDGIEYARKKEKTDNI